MTRKSILEAASACVLGQRETRYGKPEDNFQNIANLWNAYLDEKRFTSDDVAVMMILLKIARLKGSNDIGNLDSWVDICGYAACGGEIFYNEKEKERMNNE